MTERKICSVEGCGKTVQGRGWCSTHYSRWYRRMGDPDVGDRGFGSSASERAAVVSYSGMHSRLVAEYGPARRLRCVDCNGPAMDWSFSNDCRDAETVLHDGYFVTYCMHYKCYSPRCRACHNRLDHPHQYEAGIVS